MGFEYVEADDYHGARQKPNGQRHALTDAHREPWIQAPLRQAATTRKRGQKRRPGLFRPARRPRARFRGLGLPVQFIHLVGDKDLIRSRMQARQNHFMPSGLVDSQFAALEPTDAESDVVSISVAETVAAIVAEATAITEGIYQPVRLVAQATESKRPVGHPCGCP